MKYCSSCHLSITGDRKRCPLCRADLNAAEPTPSPFPELPQSRNKPLLRLILLFTVVIAAVCVAVNFSYPDAGWWCLFVLAGLGSIWVSFGMAIRNRRNIPKNILWQVALISLLAVLWDWRVGFYGWSMNFVIPILCTSSIVGMAATARFTRLQIEDYILYLTLLLLLGIVSAILLFCGIVTVLIPSLISIVSCVVALACLVLFEGNALRAELHRRFHW